MWRWISSINQSNIKRELFCANKGCTIETPEAIWSEHDMHLRRLYRILTQDLETEESWKRLEELGIMCINQAYEVPFEDPAVRNDVWKTSEIGIAAFPMGSFYVCHEEWPVGVEDLALENPDSIFFDLVTTEVISTAPRHDLINFLDCCCRTLANLYRNGIKAEIVARYISQKGMPSSSQIYNCTNGHSLFCQDGPTHLLHSLNMERHRKEHRSVVRQHIQHMLAFLLKHAEDPRLRCCCPRAQAANYSRTPTEIAAAKGVLDIWAKALAEAGIDPEEFHLDDFAAVPVDVVQPSQAGRSESQASSASTRLNLSRNPSQTTAEARVDSVSRKNGNLLYS